MSTANNQHQPGGGFVLRSGSDTECTENRAAVLSSSDIFASANKAELTGDINTAVALWRLAAATAGYFPPYCNLVANNIQRATGSGLAFCAERFSVKTIEADAIYFQELTRLKRYKWPDGLAEAVVATEQHTHDCSSRLSVAECPPLVSIIMPTYNRAAVITQAITTVLQQYYSNWELLVCDDASTDDTENLVKTLNDDRVQYLKLPKGGAAAARNAGLTKAKGQVIAYLDSDNFWHPAFLLQMVDKLLHTPDSHAVYCHFIDYKLLHAEVSLQQAQKSKSDSELAPELMVRPFHQPAFCYQRIQQRNFIDLNCFMHWRYLYEVQGGFNEQLTRRQDYELILRYSWAKAPVQLKQVLALYRRDEALKPITYEYQHDHSCDSHIAATLKQLKQQPLAQNLKAKPLLTLLADTYNSQAAELAEYCASLLASYCEVELIWLTSPKQRFWPNTNTAYVQQFWPEAFSEYQLQQPAIWQKQLNPNSILVNFSASFTAIALSTLAREQQQMLLVAAATANQIPNNLLLQAGNIGLAPLLRLTIDAINTQAAHTQTPVASIVLSQILLATKRQSTLIFAASQHFGAMLTSQWKSHLRRANAAD